LEENANIKGRPKVVSRGKCRERRQSGERFTSDTTVKRSQLAAQFFVCRANDPVVQLWSAPLGGACAESGRWAVRMRPEWRLKLVYRLEKRIKGQQWMHPHPEFGWLRRQNEFKAKAMSFNSRQSVISELLVPQT
jgi:hypothetical protein